MSDYLVGTIWRDSNWHTFTVERAEITEGTSPERDVTLHGTTSNCTPRVCLWSHEGQPYDITAPLNEAKTGRTFAWARQDVWESDPNRPAQPGSPAWVNLISPHAALVRDATRDDGETRATTMHNDHDLADLAHEMRHRAETAEAKIALIEAVAAEWESDRDVCLAWINDPSKHVDPDHPARLSAMADILNQHASRIHVALSDPSPPQHDEENPPTPAGPSLT